MPTGTPSKQPVTPQKKEPVTTPKKVVKKTVQQSSVPSQPQETPIKKNVDEIELEKLNRVFYFYGPQSSQPKNIQLDDKIKNGVLNLKNDENIPMSLAYVIFVYENYGPISYINVPSEYSKDLLNQKLSVELPQIMESKGLINLLFEQLTPTRNRVTLKIEDGVVKQPTTNVRKNITIEDIINSNLELKPSGPSNSLPDESDIVYQVKFKLSQKEGNDKWNGDMNKVMTPEFSKFLSDYQTKNQLPITGNIDADLIKNLFPNVLKPKTTTVPPTTTSQKDIKKSVTTSEFANNKNVRDIITYSKRVDTTGEPDWDVCRMLIDEYSKKIPTIVQSISVGNLSPVSENDPTLKSIKKSVEWCIAKHRNKFRLKISDMNRISNLETPFSINKDIL